MSASARGTALVLLSVLALAGCAGLRRERVEPALPPAPVAVTPPPVVRVEPPPPRTAQRPRSCVPARLGPPPRYPDSDRALREAAGAADRYQLLAAGRLMRMRRLEELERIVQGCR